MSQPTRKQVDFVRLSKGITRALAHELLEQGFQLPGDWEQQLDGLYELEGKEKDEIHKAERTTKKSRRDRAMAENAAGQTPSQLEAAE